MTIRAWNMIMYSNGHAPHGKDHMKCSHSALFSLQTTTDT